MKSSPPTWALRALWLCLPFSLGDIFSAALDERGATLVTVWQLALWSIWALVLGSLLVQLPVTLTFIRICVPVSLVLGIGFASVAATSDKISVAGAVGLAIAAVVSVLVMGGDIGDDFINGASYGDERRLALRPPGFLILGPVQLVWVLTVAPAVAGVAMVASERWWEAAVAAALAVASGWFGFRTLNRLSTRCLVLVPAGMTMVDHLSLAEPTLFRREQIVRVGPAPVDSDGFDLTAGAPGLVLSAEFSEPLTIVPAARRGESAETTAVEAVLLAVSRPGRLLELAESRRIAVERR